MVTIGMNYKVRPGKEAVFEEAFRKVVHAMRNMEGHTESLMFRQVDDPFHYLIMSQWSKKEAFDAFVGSETFRNVANWGKEEILSARPRHEVYEG